MNTMVRTTITLPSEFYEQLRTASFYRKKTISQLVREGVSRVIGYKKPDLGKGIENLMGKYSLSGKTGEFSRKNFYEKIIKQKMSFGY